MLNGRKKNGGPLYRPFRQSFDIQPFTSFRRLKSEMITELRELCLYLNPSRFGWKSSL